MPLNIGIFLITLVIMSESYQISSVVKYVMSSTFPPVEVTSYSVAVPFSGFVGYSHVSDVMSAIVSYVSPVVSSVYVPAT